MTKSKAITIITASFILFGVTACKPSLPAPVERIFNAVDAPAPDPACPTVASCLPQGSPPPTTVQPCGTTEANPCQPDPACPTVASCLPQGPPPPPPAPRPCGLTEAEPCP